MKNRGEQTRRRRGWRWAALLVLASLPCLAQDTSSNPSPDQSQTPAAPGNQGRRGRNPGQQGLGQQGQGQQGQGQQVKNPPQAVLHNGVPALRYNARAFGYYVDMVKWQGEPALRFPSAIGSCTGSIYVTRTRVSGQFSSGPSCQSFDAPREQVQAEKAGLPQPVQLTTPSGNYTVSMVVEGDGGTTKVVPPGHEAMVRSIKNFDNIYRYFRRTTAEVSGGASGQQGAGGQNRAGGQNQKGGNAQAMGVQVSLHTDPGDVQVYVNDEPRGLTSEEGNEVLHLKPGTYNLRLDLPGYKEWTQAVTVAAGKPQDVTAKLETTGPPPFTAADIAEMLEGKVSAKRVTSLVEERGVDFSLNDDLEKRFRAAGADDALLLAIATKKK